MLLGIESECIGSSLNVQKELKRSQIAGYSLSSATLPVIPFRAILLHLS